MHIQGFEQSKFNTLIYVSKRVCQAVDSEQTVKGRGAGLGLIAVIQVAQNGIYLSFRKELRGSRGDDQNIW